MRQYDAAGDIVGGGNNLYLYNADGKICAVQWTYNSITVMTGYIYDADGNRVAKGAISTWGSCDPSVNGFTPTAEYVRDQAGHQLSEFAPGQSGAMAWQHTNVYANGTLIATEENTETHFYLNDWLGTRRVQTNYAGVVEQKCSSLPYGDDENCSPAPSGALFTGKERDTESGLDNFGARYYGSSMGRFMSPDPSGLTFADQTNPQSFNAYAYADNNPLIFIDPSGLWLQINCTTNGHDYDTSTGNTTTVHGSTASCSVFDDGKGGYHGFVPQKRQPSFPLLPRNFAPNKNCPTVPTAPPGVTVNNNMKQARRNALWNPFWIPWFKNQVQYGGPWDYKTQGAQYEDFGNFNYGATGTAAFAPSFTLLRAAGWAQRNHPSSPQFGGDPGSLLSIFLNPFGGTAPYGDDPHDQQMIQQGIQYARNGCGG